MRPLLLIFGATLILWPPSLIVLAAAAEDLNQAIDHLTSDRFAVRRAAMLTLTGAGRAAIEPLAAAVERYGKTPSGAEGVVRSIAVLKTLSFSDNLKTSAAAADALTRLGQSASPLAASRAKAALRSHQRRVVAKIEALGGNVYHENETVTAVSFDGSNVRNDDLRMLCKLPSITTLSLGGTQISDAGMAHLTCLKKLDDLNLYRTNVGDEGMRHLKAIKSLRRLPAGETRVTDAGLAHLKDMTQLEYLGMRGNNVTDAGLVYLKKLTSLTGLYLGETKVTDAGLAHIRHLSKMTYLRLHTLNVSDAAVEHLKELKALERIDLYSTQVTEKGFQRLRQALPNCVVKTNAT